MTTHFPIALILTHAQGAGVAILKQKEDFCDFKSPLLCEGPFEFYQPKSTAVFALCSFKTAENLCDLYGFCLKKVELDKPLTLAVGVGPGSFTGLRLGCGFANGLKLGDSSLCLLPVPTAFVSAQSVVSFLDLFCALRWVQGVFESQPWRGCESSFFVDSLLPEYGREPGPVLKLREQNEPRISY